MPHLSQQASFVRLATSKQNIQSQEVLILLQDGVPRKASGLASKFASGCTSITESMSGVRDLLIGENHESVKFLVIFLAKPVSCMSQDMQLWSYGLLGGLVYLEDFVVWQSLVRKSENSANLFARLRVCRNFCVPV